MPQALRRLLQSRDYNEIFTPQVHCIYFAASSMDSTLVGGLPNTLKVGREFVMLPLMVRLLGPNECGLYALAMPTIMFAIVFADGGLGTSSARELESNVDVWSTALWVLLGAAAIRQHRSKRVSSPPLKNNAIVR